MAEQTTDDGITVEQIDNAYEVLEILRENFQNDGLNGFAETVNEAHYLVQQYDKNANWSKTYNLPEAGDVLVDVESDPRFGDGRVEVSEVVGAPADTHFIETERGRHSVAYLNPSHPADAPVVNGRYVEGSDKVYAFPVTRLSET